MIRLVTLDPSWTAWDSYFRPLAMLDGGTNQHANNITSVITVMAPEEGDLVAEELLRWADIHPCYVTFDGRTGEVWDPTDPADRQDYMAQARDFLAEVMDRER